MGCCNPVKCAMMQTVVLVGMAAGAAALHFKSATDQRAMIDRFLTPPTPAVVGGAKAQAGPVENSPTGAPGAAPADPKTDDGPGDEPSPAQPADPDRPFSLDDLGEMITIDQAVKIYNLPYEDPQAPQVIFLDARSREKYDRSHILSAYHVTPESFFNGTLPDDIDFWPKDSIIVVYCDGGECDASHLVEARLEQQKGFERIYLIEAGFPGWQSAGLPTESGPPSN